MVQIVSPLLVDFSGTMSVVQAEECHERLASALATGNPVAVDCGEVVEADVCFIQLLIAARTSAARRGVSFSLKQPLGPGLTAALQRGGFISEPLLPGEEFWAGVERQSR
jgi:hypothetical protein